MSIAIGLGIGISFHKSPNWTQRINRRFEIPLSSANVRNMEVFVNSLKSGGVWDKLFALYNFWIHDEQAVRVNWKEDIDTLIPINGDLFFEIKDGIWGSGTASSACLRMSTKLTDIVTKDNYSFGFFVNDLSDCSLAHYIDGCHDGLVYLLAYFADATNIYIYGNGAVNQVTFGAAPYMVGVTGDDNHQRVFKDGILQDDITRVAGNLPALPMAINGRNSNGVFNETGSPVHQSLFYIGSKLTADEHKTISDAFGVWRTNFSI